MLKTNKAERVEIEALQKLGFNCVVATPTGHGGYMEIVAAYRDMGAALDAAANITPPGRVYDVDRILSPELADRADVAADHAESLGY
jgi:hypothetical protein